MDDFSPEAFFHLSTGPIGIFFKRFSNVWDAVGALPEYIERILEPGLFGEVEEGAWLEPNRVRLEKGSRVERGAIVRGPTIIGRNTVVRSGAYIRGHLWTGEECLIGHGTETRQLLMMDRSNLPHLNCFFTSVIGNDVKIGGSTHTANMRLDQKEVKIRVEVKGKKQLFNTYQTLFGAIIGDGSSVGGVSLLQAGTVIGKKCMIFPMCSVSGYLPHGSIVKPKGACIDISSHPKSHMPS
jgi:NDP-sugar pyrophosphorylase family protein